MNNDALADLLLGAPEMESGDDDLGVFYAGLVFIDVDGDGIAGTSGMISGTDCDDSDDSVAANQTYYADSDGDGFGDGASSTTLCSMGVPTGYVTNDDDANDNDFDNDGVETEDDCDDIDDSVSSENTYYADTDGDDLGDPDAAAAFCSASAPTGYVDNDDDIAGEVVEETPAEEVTEEEEDVVEEEEVEEEIPEEETAEEEPTTVERDLSSVDPSDSEEFTSLVSSVEGLTEGRIRVHFSDGTSVTYTIFDTPNAQKKTKVLSYDSTGYLLVLHPKGKKLKLVNVYTGVTLDGVQIAKKKFPARSLKLLDLRGDDSVEAVVTMKKGKTKKLGRLVVVKVSISHESLVKKDAVNFTSKKVRVKRTKAKESNLNLRNKNGKKVLSHAVTTNYNLLAR
jgi:hypothetical protein